MGPFLRAPKGTVLGFPHHGHWKKSEENFWRFLKFYGAAAEIYKRGPTGFARSEKIDSGPLVIGKFSQVVVCKTPPQSRYGGTRPAAPTRRKG